MFSDTAPAPGRGLRDALAAVADAAPPGEAPSGPGAPSLAHALSVAGLALEHGASEDAAVAALLVASGAADRLAPERFGAGVGRLVAECHDASATTWQAGKRVVLDGVPRMSEDALLVTASDALVTARAILLAHRDEGESVWDGLAADRSRQLWFHWSLVEALRREAPARALPAGTHRVIAGLELVVQELHAEASAAAGPDLAP